jgi:hypothetical protein
MVRLEHFPELLQKLSVRSVREGAISWKELKGRTHGNEPLRYALVLAASACLERELLARRLGTSPDLLRKNLSEWRGRLADGSLVRADLESSLLATGGTSADLAALSRALTPP